MMIKIFFLILFLGINISYAESQTDLNQAACNELKKTDQKLNSIYQKILIKYHDDSAFIDQLKIAQNKWIEFRDAYLASRYVPKYEDSYGSVSTMCQCTFLDNVTNERIKQLQVWLDGIEEGDVCVGSVKN